MEKNHNILIADNESIVTFDLKDQLNKWGYTVLTSNGNNSTTRDLIKENNPDAVIIDDDYPFLEEGIKTAERISRQYRIGIVLLCAWMNDEVERMSSKLDSFQCLSKPFTNGELQKSLEFILKKKAN
ncbi:MAG: response regulator [bacterium]